MQTKIRNEREIQEAFHATCARIGDIVVRQKDLEAALRRELTTMENLRSEHQARAEIEKEKNDNTGKKKIARKR